MALFLSTFKHRGFRLKTAAIPRARREGSFPFVLTFFGMKFVLTMSKKTLVQKEFCRPHFSFCNNVLSFCTNVIFYSLYVSDFKQIYSF